LQQLIFLQQLILIATANNFATANIFASHVGLIKAGTVATLQS
jgi:hypothetical protein